MKYPTDHNVDRESLLKFRNWLRKGAIHKRDIFYPDLARECDTLADAIDVFCGIKKESYMDELENEFWGI